MRVPLSDEHVLHGAEPRVDAGDPALDFGADLQDPFGRVLALDRPKVAKFAATEDFAGVKVDEPTLAVGVGFLLRHVG